MKKTISIIAIVAMVMSLFTGTVFAGNGNGNGNGKGHGNQSELSDVKGHWGEAAIESLQSSGILTGYEDGTFKPNKTLTEAELAVILDRIQELKVSNAEDNDDEDSDLKDDSTLVEDDDLSGVPGWAKKAVKKQAEDNVINLKKFHSEAQVNRLEACIRIAKALESADKLAVNHDTKNITNPFHDLDIEDKDYVYILALYDANLIKGYPDGNFNPKTILTRAQIAAILGNILDDEDQPSDDKTAPEWDDAALTASAITADSVKLTWSGADDDEGVVGYKVMYKLNGDDKVKYTANKRIVIGGLDADEKYTFAVEAKDAAGNWSDDGPDLDVRTQEADTEEDTTAPTWDDDDVLKAETSGAGIVVLDWPAANGDDVDSYLVYQDGHKIQTLPADTTECTVKKLDAGIYNFKVKAVDESGNKSVSLSKKVTVE